MHPPHWEGDTRDSRKWHSGLAFPSTCDSASGRFERSAAWQAQFLDRSSTECCSRGFQAYLQRLPREGKQHVTGLSAARAAGLGCFSNKKVRNTYSLSKAAGKQPLETVRIHHTVTICSPASPHWVLHAVTLSSLLSIKFTTGRDRLNTQSGLQSILHNLSDTGLKGQIFAKVYRQNFSITEQFCTQCNKALQIDIPQDKQRCLSPSLGIGLFWVCTVASSSHWYWGGRAPYSQRAGKDSSAYIHAGSSSREHST